MVWLQYNYYKLNKNWLILFESNGSKIMLFRIC